MSRSDEVVLALYSWDVASSAEDSTKYPWVEAALERVCFLLQVKPERLDEYKTRHREVWPEMKAALSKTGWGNYSLFLRADGLLVGYVETPSFDKALEGMAALEVNERWQREMKPFFVELEGRPDEGMFRLEEVFHLD